MLRLAPSQVKGRKKAKRLRKNFLQASHLYLDYQQVYEKKSELEAILKVLMEESLKLENNIKD